MNAEVKADGAASKKKRRIDDWEVEDALRTLGRAKEIQRDKALMSRVRTLAKKKLDDMRAITGNAGE